MPVETQHATEDDNRVLLIRRLERPVEQDATDVLDHTDADDLDADPDEQVPAATTTLPEAPESYAEPVDDRREQAEADRAAREEAKEASAASRRARAEIRAAAKRAEAEEKQAAKRAAVEAREEAKRAAEQKKQADIAAKEAAKHAAVEAKEAAKRAAVEAKEAAKQAKREGKRPAAAVAGEKRTKRTRRERNLDRDIEVLGLVQGEAPLMMLRGRSYGPATLVITNYRVALVSGRRTKVRWIPLEEVNQIDTMWRGAPTVLIGGTVELLRFRMRSANKLTELVHAMMDLVQAAKVPGSAHHSAEVTQMWCDMAGEVWDSQTGRIRLFIRRHPVFMLGWLTTLVPLAYLAAR